MKKFLALALLVSLSSALLAAPCNWPLVRHDTNNSGDNPCETIINPGNVGTISATPIWQDNIASVSATPVVQNGNVYYGNWNGDFQRRDIQTGAVLATRNFPGQIFGSPASLSATAVYVSTNDLVLHVLDPLTLADIIPPISIDVTVPPATASIFSAPVLVENLVIVSTSNSTAEETTTLSPTFRGALYAFNATTGAPVWTFVVNQAPLGTGVGIWSTAAVDTKLKLIFVGTGNATTPPAGPHSDALLAIDYTNGTLRWAQQYTKNDVWSALYPCGADLNVGASPNLFTICKKGKKIDVVGASSKAGCYRVFERKTGKPVWSTSIKPKNAVASVNGNPSAAFANDTIYAVANVDNSGIPFNVLSILAQYGCPFSTCHPEAFFQLVKSIQTTDHTFIKALDATTGCQKWVLDYVSPSYPGMTLANGVLYIGNALGIFRALDAQTGAILNTIPIPLAFDFFPANLCTGTIVVTEGRVLVPHGIGGPALGGLFVYGLP